MVPDLGDYALFAHGGWVPAASGKNFQTRASAIREKLRTRLAHGGVDAAVTAPRRPSQRGSASPAERGTGCCTK